MKQSRLSIKLRGKISHACNSVITILTTKRRKQLQGTSCNLESFVMLTFCFAWFFLLQRQRAFLFQQLYHFLITEEEFRLRRRNRQMLLKILAQIKQQDVHRWRRAWVWPRPQNWFKNLLASPALDFLWKEHFWVTQETFEFLCDLVRVKLQKQQTSFRVPVSVEERVGLALWRLATGNSYRSCGLQFGLGKSTAKVICSEFEQAIFDLRDRFIKFPLTSEENGEKIEEFEELYGIPK